MDKNVYFSIPKDVTHGRGYIYSLQYHIVWVTKYRKPIFVGEIEADIRPYLLDTLKSLDMVPHCNGGHARPYPSTCRL